MLTAFASLTLLLLSPQRPPPEVGKGLEPSPNPVAWEFEFRFLDPKRIEVALPGTGKTEVYWYVVYTVVNPGPRGQRFFPLFQIVTEDLHVFDTDTGISPLVFDAIKERHAVTHKYLVHPTQAYGALLAGEDNARESVAIWRDIDLTQNSFTLYVAGLSGEVRFVKNPKYDPARPETAQVAAPDGQPRTVETNPKSFTLRKTLEVRYGLPGSPQARTGVLPERGATHWIMR
jgi:hypothetical protein